MGLRGRLTLNSFSRGLGILRILKMHAGACLFVRLRGPSWAPETRVNRSARALYLRVNRRPSFFGTFCGPCLKIVGLADSRWVHEPFSGEGVVFLTPFLVEGSHFCTFDFVFLLKGSHF